MSNYDCYQTERKILKSLDAELTDLRPYLDEYTLTKLQKTIRARQLDLLNRARDAEA